MLIGIAILAVLFAVERLLFSAAERLLTGIERPYLQEIVLLWGVLNVLAAIVLGPIIFAMKVTGFFLPGPGGWPQRLRQFATAFLYVPGGALIGAGLGFVLGGIVGFALDPGSNPHNFDGIFRGFVIVAGTVFGAVMGAVGGFIVGLVRVSRQGRLTSELGESETDSN
jgi:hypothetical protein